MVRKWLIGLERRLGWAYFLCLLFCSICSIENDLIVSPIVTKKKKSVRVLKEEIGQQLIQLIEQNTRHVKLHAECVQMLADKHDELMECIQELFAQASGGRFTISDPTRLEQYYANYEKSYANMMCNERELVKQRDNHISFK